MRALNKTGKSTWSERQLNGPPAVTFPSPLKSLVNLKKSQNSTLMQRVNRSKNGMNASAKKKFKSLKRSPRLALITND